MRHRLPIASVLALALTALLLSACGGGSSSSSSTEEGTGSIETQLSEKVGEAGEACIEAASSIGGATARGAAEGACRSLLKSVEAQVPAAAEAAEGSIESAVDELTAQCRNAASKLSFGKEAVSKLCEEIEALK
jgi:hypothetical protein